MRPEDKIHKSWYPMMETLLNQAPIQHLREKVLPDCVFHPKSEDIFNVFQMDMKDIKVIILGQDPYPTPGDANGYAFLKNSIGTPKSLQIISKEIMSSDYENVSVLHVDSEEQIHKKVLPITWTEQGVFLLNTALTVESRNAGSHLKYWKNFTAALISHISIYHNCIWLLWGKHAQWFEPCIQSMTFKVEGYDKDTIEELPNDDYNYVLTAPHPAAEAYKGGKAGFYGCNHFYFVNKILEKQGKSPITW